MIQTTMIPDSPGIVFMVARGLFLKYILATSAEFEIRWNETIILNLQLKSAFFAPKDLHSQNLAIEQTDNSLVFRASRVSRDSTTSRIRRRAIVWDRCMQWGQ